MSAANATNNPNADGNEEPNFVIYNLIKEIDYLIETSNYVTNQ